MKPDVSLIFVTCNSEVSAIAMVRSLVEESLIACGNIVPRVRSIYSWKGEIEEEEEVLVIIKTTDSMSNSVVSRIVTEHPYDTPEVLKVAVEGGCEPYLEWVRHTAKGKII